MSAHNDGGPVDVLAVLDRQLRDRAERANRYRKNAEKSARKSGEPQITADRMAAYTDLQLVELREARAAVAALIAERDALREEVAALRQQPAPASIDSAGKVEVEPSAVRPFNATKPAECAKECPPQQVCDYCQIASNANQPAPVVFRNDGNSESDFIAHHEDACTACGGSGHKSDQQPAPVVDDAMRQDAERYRWVRSINTPGYLHFPNGEMEDGLALDALDRAIDAARAQGVQS